MKFKYMYRIYTYAIKTNIFLQYTWEENKPKLCKIQIVKFEILISKNIYVCNMYIYISNSIIFFVFPAE